MEPSTVINYMSQKLCTATLCGSLIESNNFIILHTAPSLFHAEIYDN